MEEIKEEKVLEGRKKTLSVGRYERKKKRKKHDINELLASSILSSRPYYVPRQKEWRAYRISK